MHANERRNRWTWAMMAVLVAGTLAASPVEAGLRARCRAACKPLLTGCATIGKGKRACKRAILRGVGSRASRSATSEASPRRRRRSPRRRRPRCRPRGQVVLHVDDISRDGSLIPADTTSW